MRLKRALSQIRPTDEQREKIYDDILEKLSEDQPEKEKETKFVMKKRKMITSVVAAAAAVIIVGSTVYAASPEVREAVNNILGINRESIEDFYEIKNAEGKNTMSVTGIEAIEDGVTITENDFKEFAEGIRTKLVSVINTGNSVELLLEFEFDEPVTAVEYSIDYLNFTIPKAVMKKQLDYSYGYGSLKASDNGRIYGDVGLNFTGYIPEGIEITLELNSLSYCPLGVPVENEKIIEGYYSTDFVIGPPVKSYSINIEPTEISWTQPYMGDAVAKMELSGLEYSPKYISVDLRMLDDCLVNYEFDPKAKYGTANYLNSTEMFFEGGNGKGSEFNPIKFKMSDGTLKDVQYDWVHSNAIMEFDMSAFETDTNIKSDDSPTVTTVRSDEKTEISAVQKSDYQVRITQDIPNDRPASITFEFNGIMDYSDVEAIVFCGVEIPIN